MLMIDLQKEGGGHRRCSYLLMFAATTCEPLFVEHARKNVQTHSRALAVQRDYIYGVSRCLDVFHTVYRVS